MAQVQGFLKQAKFAIVKSNTRTLQYMSHIQESIVVLGGPKCCFSGVRAKVREMEFRWVRAGESEQLCTKLEKMTLIKDFNDKLTNIIVTK